MKRQRMLTARNILYIIIAISFIGGLTAGGLLRTSESRSAEFEVLSLDISPHEASEGETVTVIADIINKGDKDGTYHAVFKVNGLETEQGQTDVWIPARQIEQVELTIVGRQPGNFEVEIGGLKGSITITSTVTPTPQPTPLLSPTPTDGNVTDISPG